MQSTNTIDMHQWLEAVIGLAEDRGRLRAELAARRRRPRRARRDNGDRDEELTRVLRQLRAQGAS